MYVARKRCMSHLDPIAGPVLACRAAKRLQHWFEWCKVNGQGVMFLTLTYDPKLFGDPNDHDTNRKVYVKARDGKHVSRLMSALSQALQIDLKGKWICKTEFQKTGLLHFHVLVRGMRFIPHQLLRDLWGKGHVFAQQAKKSVGSYISKYQAKTADYPEFMYRLPRRGVKIWGTSPGFWKVVEGEHADPDEETKKAIKELVIQSQSRDEYNPDETIGEAIERARGCVVVRDENGKREEYKTDYGAFVHLLKTQGCDLKENYHGWLVYEKCNWKCVEIMACYARSMLLSAHGDHDFNKSLEAKHGFPEQEYYEQPTAAPPAASAAGEERAGHCRGFYLINVQDRDFVNTDKGEAIHDPDYTSPIPIEDWPDDAAPF